MELVVPKRRGIGGMLLHADGGVVVSGRDLAHVRDGETRVVMEAPEGVTGFNDMTSGERGEIYVGTLRFHPFKGESPVPGEVWRIDPDGAAEIVADGIDWPNGVGLSPDGETIYVCDYAAGTVVAGGTVFATSPRGSADGLAVDAEGGVWIALGEGKGVARFDPDGEVDRIVDVPADFVSSLCFGGPDLREMFVTIAGGLLRTSSDVAGRPRPAAAALARAGGASAAIARSRPAAFAR